MLIITAPDKRGRYKKYAEVENIEMIIIIGKYIMKNFKPNEDFIVLDDKTLKTYLLTDFMRIMGE